MKQKNFFGKTVLLFTIVIAGFLLNIESCIAQATEEKPKYAPGKEKNRNKTDEIGRKQGKWVFYNTFGEKISEIDFVNDKKEGIERRFYGYDRVKEETEYLAGVKEGQYTRYYFSSQVQMEGTYKDGKKNGKWTKYFEDGSNRQEGSYVNGKKDGPWKAYNRKGDVVGQATYKDGIDVDVLDAKKKKEEEAKKATEKKGGDKKGPAPTPALKPNEPKK